MTGFKSSSRNRRIVREFLLIANPSRATVAFFGSRLARKIFKAGEMLYRVRVAARYPVTQRENAANG